jgi:hypothetical protein
MRYSAWTKARVYGYAVVVTLALRWAFLYETRTLLTSVLALLMACCALAVALAFEIELIYRQTRSAR